MRREPKNLSILVPRFQRGGGILNHTGGTYSHDGMLGCPRIPFTEWNLGNILDSVESSKLERNWCLSKNSRTSDHHALDQRTWDCHIKWRIYDLAIDYGERFSWLRYAWCDDCFSVEKASQHAVTFPKKSKCRRAACSETRPILTRKTDCVHDLRALSSHQSYEAVQGLSDLFKKTLTEWWCSRLLHKVDQALLAACEILTDMVLEGMYKSYCRILFCFRLYLALYDQETVRNHGQLNYSRLKTVCETSCWSNKGNSKFQSAERSCWEGGVVTKSPKGRRPALIGRCENACSGKQMENIRKETCGFRHCCSPAVRQCWYQFVFNIDAEGLVKYIFNFKSSNRAKWRTSFRKLERITPKTQKPNKKRDGNRDSDDRLRDLPQWWEEFTDNLEDTEVLAPAHLITADHKVLKEEGESRSKHWYAIVAQDLATQLIQPYPCKTKTFQETEKSLQKFLEPSHKPKSCLYRQFVGVWKILWRPIMESSNLNTSPIRDEWHCWKSRTKCQRGTLAIRIGWKVVGWF